MSRRLRKRRPPQPSSRAPVGSYPCGLVSVVVLTRNRLDLIKGCIDSVELNLSDRYQVEILVGDTGSTEPDVWSFYQSACRQYDNIRLVELPGYHYSSNYNRLLNEHARGEFVVLLNNDTIATPGWLDRLIDPLAIERIGIVGAKLLYLDHTIQHAGIEFDAHGNGVHSCKHRPRNWPEANYPALVPALTFACVALRHETFDRFQLNEDFREECQDADFCMRVHEAGYDVLYNPEAELYHLECSSRDWRLGEQDRVLLRRLWGRQIRQFAARASQRARFERNEYGNSITVIRDGGIGDLLMGVSAFQEVREMNPGKEMILATCRSNIEMMAGFGIFDKFIPIPDGDKWAPIPTSVSSLKYNFISCEMERGRPKEINKVHRHLMYAGAMGCLNGFHLVPMPDYPQARKRVREMLDRMKIDAHQEFVALNLLATNPARSWWPPYYPELIAAIERMGFVPLVLGRENSRYFKGRKLVNLVGSTTTVTEYIEALKCAKYVISTDTSAYHIAGLSRIPFLAIFSGGVKPEARLGLYSRYEVAQPPAGLDCYPCWDEGCSDVLVRWKKEPCRLLISPEQVISKFIRLVERYPSDTSSASASPCAAE